LFKKFVWDVMFEGLSVYYIILLKHYKWWYVHVGSFNLDNQQWISSMWIF
jgi:hypothetical protein